MDEIEQYDVICIGAGLSGLTACYTLLKSDPNLKLCLLEAKERVGGRTYLQKLKCADKDGRDDEYEWEMGGMWVGSCQKAIMELLAELDIGTYDQYVTGTKCLQLDDDSVTKTYSSNLPSVGLLGTIDLGQAMLRMERLIGSIDPSNPYSHPEASVLDSMTIATFLQKYSWTAKVKDMVQAAFRTVFGADCSQLNALYCLAYCASAGGLRPVIESTAGTAQEFKIKGGSQGICMKMANDHIGFDRIKLSMAVTVIEQTEDHAVVECRSGTMYYASYVILAIPPHQIPSIRFTPPLPNSKTRLYKQMPVGHIIKVIITYRKAYWREKGFSGEVVTTDPRPQGLARGALSIVYDATSDQGHPALVAFIGGDQATAWADNSAAERKEVVLNSLTKFFSCPELMGPIDYAEKDWAKEEYNGGCPVSFVTPGAMQYYNSGLQTPFLRLEHAGTETSQVWCGFLSGAVAAGKRAAHNVLEKLGRGMGGKQL